MVATFYADSDPSAISAGSGTGVDASNPCALKEFCEDDVILHTARAAGDVCYVKNGTTIDYDGSAGIFVTAAVAGTVAAPVRVIGYQTTIADGGVVVINDTDSGASADCFHFSIDYWSLENFKITNPKRGVHTTTAVSGLHLRNIEVDTAADVGINISSNAGPANFYENCYVHGSSSDGFKDARRAGRYMNCVAIGNTGDGFDVGNSTLGCILIDCLSHGNTGRGFRVTGQFVLINCTSNRNTSDGYYVAVASYTNAMVNCGATSNSGYGVSGAVGTNIHAINCGLNPTNETNTSGESHANVSLHKVGELTGDPDFTDSNPATKTDVDLSVSSSSAWKAAAAKLGDDGFTGTTTFKDVGAAQREEPAGGGGTDSILGGGNLEGGFS